ncbi:MAG: ATP-binding cassette domain-containing protein [Proteobacteria bacterium]|nr:ATP-binding cassette domain-containing protein [Pseudomonadota bacterium]
MSLIVLERAALSFGGRTIFAEVSLRISQGEKIGVVGSNGSGKSTLQRILYGTQALDGGIVRRARGVRLGYLPQDVLELGEGTLLASVVHSVPGRTELLQRLEAAEAQLAATSDPDEQLELAHELADAHDRLDHFEQHYSEHQAVRILHGLGFPAGDLDRPLAQLSGGWKMRAALAGLLFQQPDVLLLDEPTNHLDLPSVLWLDGFLADYRNALVLICHDRQFLNRHIERVVSFEPEGLRQYKGDYDSYATQREAELEVLEGRRRNRERQIKEAERFVERFRATASKARQAQSRAKQIERMQRELEGPVAAPRQLRFQFPPVARSGKDAVTAVGLGKAYGEHQLYREVTRSVFAGDRVAIVGPNGVGKTTLLKLLAGELAPDTGQVRYGANIKLGYYAQHHTELLDARLTVLQQVWQVRPDVGETGVRTVCGAFLFSGDDVEKSVGVLSGGERARVLLARLLLDPGNLLLMDEPTNHLDVVAAEALATALAGYGGTLIFVSHNTSFIERLATKIWEIVDGDVVEHLGTFAEYLARKQALAAGSAPAAAKAASARAAVGKRAAPPAPAAPPEARAPAPRAEGANEQQKREQRKREQRALEAQRRDAERTQRQSRRAVEELEQRIAALEAEQKQIEPQLADPALYADPQRSRPLLDRYGELRDELERLYARWEVQQGQAAAPP